MDVRSAIATQRNKAQCLQIVDYVQDSPHRFKVLVEVLLQSPTQISQQAAWPLSICVERHPQLATPHLYAILNAASKPGVHPSVKRNVMRLLQFAHIPRRMEGKLLDLAFRFLLDKKEAIAVRVFSMTVIERLTEDKPDLRRELIVLIEEEVPFAGPAFRSRGMKIVRNSRASMFKTP